MVKLEKVLTGHESYVWDVVITPDGRTAVSASNDCTVRVWDLSSGLLRHVLAGHKSWVCSAAIDPTGTIVAAGAFDGTVRCWRLSTAEQIAFLPASGTDTKVVWLPDGRLAVGDSSGTVKIWGRNATDWNVEHEYSLHLAPILKVVTLDHREIATAAADGTAKIASVTSGEVRLLLNAGTPVMSTQSLSMPRQRLQ
ncbi:WD40 repeat domain-containing protein [Gordonia sp. NPDC057258]|uniref:WD40 repeat domain-containing protein n=1 Tax=unclassified Gordonia (in: high G+C Gram-positive bacteria) TaxID=2657482 RepID=UPI0036438639